MRSLPTRYYHAVPLHRVPYLLYTGALYSHSALRDRGMPVGPRPTVARRDRKLRLTGYVHLALEPVTPLLRDKLKKGYPHALLEFAAHVAELSGAAYLRFNPKSWRHREDFTPVTGSEEMKAFLEEWQSGQYPSAELLIPESLPLSGNLQGIYFCCETERDWLIKLAGETVPDSGFLQEVRTDLLPACTDFDWSPLWKYAENCRTAKAILPPPDLPFD